jgi:hypothetical protein
MTPDAGARPDPLEAPVTLTLVPLADARPVAVRLRMVLKDLLRQQRFKCVRLDWPGAVTGPGAGGEEAHDQ